MARLIARHDPDTGYVYVTSGDEYPIPRDVWDQLKALPYCGVYHRAAEQTSAGAGGCRSGDGRSRTGRTRRQAALGSSDDTDTGRCRSWSP